MRRLAVVLLAMGAAAAGLVTVVGATSRWTPTPTERLQLVLSTTPTAAQLRGPFTVMELDGFETPAATVTALHALGKHAVCYIDVGTWEDWRPDAKAFPKSVLGRPDSGWPGERWLDVRQRKVLLPIMAARFRRCVAKGFDAVDPDNVNGVENATGFRLTIKAQLAYDRAIAALAHADGLSVALKSFPDQSRTLEPSFDFVVDEQCEQYHECGELAPFVAHGKAVYDVEYTTSLRFCATLPDGVDGLAKHLSLNDWARWCPIPSR